MRVLTILGTRPEIIRLSRVIAKLDSICEQRIVHTGQNYDPNLDRIFFDELGVRKPDYYLGARGGFGEQLGVILAGVEKIIAEFKPDKFLVLGDTNSSMAAIVVKRAAVPVYHMEAGNRCYDDRVPEEVNRRIIDHSSDILLPYTERSRQNLLAEGIPGRRIFVTGNPIFEVLQYYKDRIDASTIFSRLGIQPHKYFLVTIHRAENVDIEARLRSFMEAFDALSRKYEVPVVVSTHPRTRERIAAWNLTAASDSVRFLPPFGFFDFVRLEREAFCVLSDSGTVQEECSILGVPSVTIRDTTERPETIEYGNNMLSGASVDDILRAVNVMLELRATGAPPPEYIRTDVSDTVCHLVTGYAHLKSVNR